MENRPEAPAHFTTSALSEADPVDVRLHHYDLLIDTTTQMLATPKLDERLLLALEAITTGLGFPHAAIALIDERYAILRMRAALGFEDDKEVARIEVPLDSGA